jgi:hypothetical protein
MAMNGEWISFWWEIAMIYLKKLSWRYLQRFTKTIKNFLNNIVRNGVE